MNKSVLILDNINANGYSLLSPSVLNMPNLDIEYRLCRNLDGIKQAIQEAVDGNKVKILFVTAKLDNEEETILKQVRATRKDIFLVAFMEAGCTDQVIYQDALTLLKRTSCNLIYATNVATGYSMVVAPEEASYHYSRTADYSALLGLIEMAYLRSHLTFTHSNVINGKPVPWDAPEIPDSLRTVIDYCIEKNAYKPLSGVTAGHFAVKLDDQTFLTSIRKTNFNDLKENGLVKVTTDGPDTVLAYGAKPSVGGQSQRIVFRDHPGYDCIVHFHSPIKPDSKVPVASQREVQCGSHECGHNTSDHLAQFGNLKAVYLENHGPNIIFNRNIDPQEVIDFIESNFNLAQKTGGFQL